MQDSQGWGPQQENWSLSGAGKLRHVEVGCVLHDKTKLGLWRGVPSECDLTNVDLKPHAGEVLHFGCIFFAENFGIHLVLKGFFTTKPQFS